MAPDFGQSDWNEEGWGPDDSDAPRDIDLIDDDDDETPTVPCPKCRKAIPDFTDRCPYCGNWVVQGAGDRRRSPWLVLMVVVVIICFVVWYVL